MRKTALIAAGLVAAAGTAQAGGIDRSGQPVGIIFETGRYAEFSLGSVAPVVSGTQTLTLSAQSTAGARSGDMAGGYQLYSFGYKQDFGKALSGALIYDQPWGADVNYPAASSLPAYYAQGSTARFKSSALTGILKYTTPGHFSVYGGLRYETVSANANIPFITKTPGVTAPYTADGAKNGAFGYLFGAAWEKPEIAARIALTFQSKIHHKLDTHETSFAGVLNSTTTINTPKSLTLDAQTGVAPNTLLFGSVRWVDWKHFDISPAMYKMLTSGGSLVAYDKSTISYTIGLGHKFDEHWAASVSLGYEPKSKGFASNLGPTDGYQSIALGGSYTEGNVKISAGIRYVKIGSAQTTLDGVHAAGDFSGNHALAVGVKVGVTF